MFAVSHSHRGKRNRECFIMPRPLIPLSLCRSVELSVGNDREFWKNGGVDRDAVRDGEWSGSKESCIRRACILAPPGRYC